MEEGREGGRGGGEGGGRESEREGGEEEHICDLKLHSVELIMIKGEMTKKAKFLSSFVPRQHQVLQHMLPHQTCINHYVSLSLYDSMTLLKFTTKPFTKT